MRARLVAFGFLVFAAVLFAASFMLSRESTGIRALDATQAIAARYGQTTSAMYAFGPYADLFSVARLAELRALTQVLGQSGACRSVLSFMGLPVIVATDDETELSELVGALPSTESEAQALRDKALQHPNGKGELLSDDGTSALVICPLVAETAPEVMARVDPTAIKRALTRDLRQWAAILALAALALMSRYRWRAAIGAIGVMFMMWRQPWQGVSLMARLNALTHANRTVLVSVEADPHTVRGVREIQQVCDELAPHGRVKCPNAVLTTLAEALTGASTLPTTDEQLKALWFFAGDRPELGLVFSDSSALIRVLLDESHDLAAIRRIAGRHHAQLGGLPLVTSLANAD